MGKGTVEDLNQSLFPYRGEFELNTLDKRGPSSSFQTVGLDEFQVSSSSLGECGSGQRSAESVALLQLRGPYVQFEVVQTAYQLPVRGEDQRSHSLAEAETAADLIRNYRGQIALPLIRMLNHHTHRGIARQFQLSAQVLAL